MSTSITPKVHVTLRLPRSVPRLLVMAQAIEEAVAANSSTFPSPTPTLAQLSADIQDLNAAETATRTRLVGSVETRNTKVAIVRSDLELLRGYVQRIADNDPANAEAIAADAGMTVRKAPVLVKADLAAKPDPSSSGTIELVAKAIAKRAAHDWQLSHDGQTWTALQSTLQAKTTVTGLVRGTTVYFRHRSLLKSGPEPWSDPVSALVQ